MKFVYFTLLSIIFSIHFTLYCQNNDIVSINGRIITENSEENYISKAHIINKNLNTGTISDDNGYYTIKCNYGDSLIISAIGFKTVRLKIQNNSNISVVMYPVTYTLNEVVIHPYKTYSEFKQAFIALKLPAEEPFMDLNYKNFEHFAFDSRINNDKTSSGAGVVIEGPITALYNAFSKKAKELKIYAELIEKDNYKLKLSKKYNPEIVKNITGIKSDETLVIFMKYCDIQDKFIETATEYELYLAINECYTSFLSECR
jgi:hypothetical protein